MRHVSVVIQAKSDPRALANDFLSAVRELDPNLAVAHVRPMDEIAGESYSTSRFALFLVGLFALLALTLAVIGTYGVVSYSISQRSHEFGVRMALGAKPRDVLAMVLGEAMRFAVTGATVARSVRSRAGPRARKSSLWRQRGRRAHHRPGLSGGDDDGGVGMLYPGAPGDAQRSDDRSARRLILAYWPPALQYPGRVRICKSGRSTCT